MTTYRLMTMDDYDEVYDLWLHTPGMGLNAVLDSREGIEKYLLRNPSTTFVAEEEGRIVGVMMAGHDGRRGMIHHTAVRESHRGRGVGSELLKRVMAAMDEEGILKVALVAFSSNEGGNAFWEKAGFHVREDLVYRDKALRPFKQIRT